MIKKDKKVIAQEDIINSAEYKRIIFKGSLIGALFLAIFVMIDFFYTKLYLDAALQAIGCIILLLIAYMEHKNRLNSLGIIFGLIVIATIIGSGAFSNNIEDGGIVWVALVPFLSFFLLGEKLGFKASLLISCIYVAVLTNIVIQFPEKGFTVNTILGTIGALLCSIFFSTIYDKNRTSILLDLAKQTETDPLTSLLNRRGIISSFENLFNLSQKNQQDLYLLVLDLDNFKQVNDNFGHDIGDLIIKSTADAVKAELRKIDRIARIGGEEFMAVLPNISFDDVLMITENVRLAIENLEITTPKGSIIKITVSIGFTKSSEEKTSFSEFFKIADKALYEAKKGGRNRVIFKE
ncbi:GGDEF domain-containing protein [Marinomonas sp. 5E14-1]|uniref:GGDEF domain-containing protein n=1 Tax=Marinomonas sp. 5E14-1 TaxID=3153922 RepID=UPI0032653FB3